MISIVLLSNARKSFLNLTETVTGLLLGSVYFGSSKDHSSVLGPGHCATVWGSSGVWKNGGCFMTGAMTAGLTVRLKGE